MAGIAGQVEMMRIETDEQVGIIRKRASPR
jgi:hypothetical protein